VGTEQLAVQPDTGDPSGDKPCILPRRHALAHAANAREQEFAGLLTRGSQVVIDGLTGLVRQLELHRPSCLPLPDRSAIDRVAVWRDVLDLEGKNEKVTLVAKLAIVRAIVEAELGSYLWVEEGTRKFRLEEAVDKSWYPDFLYLLAEGLVVNSTLDTIFDNLRIINFNYDRCIDQYLFHGLQRMFYARNAAYFSELLAKKLYVIHPYGSLGPMPWKNPANGVRFGGNHEYPEDMEKMAGRILTYNEQIQDEAIVWGIDGMIDWAEQFIFLGFHFHQQNMDLLTGKREAPSRPSEQVGAYATHVGRSTAEKDIIATQVSQMLHGRFMGSQSLKEDIDCNKLFRDYGTTFAR
jgi:hypothetical protein